MSAARIFALAGRAAGGWRCARARGLRPTHLTGARGSLLSRASIAATLAAATCGPEQRLAASSRSAFSTDRNRASAPLSARNSSAPRTIVLGALLFLALSGALARFLSVENVERDDAAALLQAPLRGEVNAMLDMLSGCRDARVVRGDGRANANRLRAPGEPKILALKSPTALLADGRHRRDASWRGR